MCSSSLGYNLWTLCSLCLLKDSRFPEGVGWWRLLSDSSRKLPVYQVVLGISGQQVMISILFSKLIFLYYLLTTKPNGLIHLPFKLLFIVYFSLNVASYSSILFLSPSNPAETSGTQSFQVRGLCSPLFHNGLVLYRLGI